MKSVLAVLLVVSTAPAHAAEATSVKPRAACFYAQSASNFAVADDYTVHVRSGVKNVFELKLYGPCLDLSSTHALGLVPRGSSMICEGKLADVDIVTRGAGLGPQRCRVSEVRKMTPEQVQALPGKARP